MQRRRGGSRPETTAKPTAPLRAAPLGAALALCLSGGDVWAQGLQTSHPVVPAAGIAAENGPGTMWVNPANMGYDPDARFGLLASRGGEDAPTSLAATVGGGGLGFGLHNHLRPSGLGVASDWSLDYGTSIKLPERISVGLLLSWRFVQDGINYVAYDAGASWRPLPWLGVGGVAQNVGDPDPNGFTFSAPRTGAGIALRPAGSLLVAGADYVRIATIDDDGALGESHLVGSLRVRPVEGLYLRGSVDGVMGADGLQSTAFSGGVEIYFGGVGGGYVASSDVTGSGQTLMIGSDEPGESLIRSGRRVPSLKIDQPPAYQPRRGLLGSTRPSWLDTLELLRRAEGDPGVQGLVLTLDGAGLSFARSQELRARIVSLEKLGKPVLIYLTGSPANLDYYVASAASRVAMHPAADLGLTGLSVELVHLRGVLDIVGVQPQFVKRSDYKSAPETFTETEPSMANLEMTEALVDDLYDELVETVAAGRGTETSVVRGWIDGGPHSASDALGADMVDVLLYPDQLEGELRKLHDGSVSVDALLELPQPHSPWEDPKQIAIVYVEGAIVSGRSSRGGLLSGRTAGSDTIVRQLNRARNDPQVQAVVMRVDSPGGSSFASDEIWRATERLEDKGKPVVVSMGTVAASGGYYVAAGADAIWAEPTTITGSIGVYSGKFSTGALQERLGITTAAVSRGRNATISSGATPWDDLQRERMQSLVDQTYEQFKERVADGRQLESAVVEEVARGRVWSGTRALDHDLVDGLGGFQDAIADARARAGIREGRKVGLVQFTDSGDLLESLTPDITDPGPLQLLPPGLRAALERTAERRAADRRDVERLLGQIGPLDALTVPLLYPDEQLWLLDPYILQLDDR